MDIETIGMEMAEKESLVTAIESQSILLSNIYDEISESGLVNREQILSVESVVPGAITDEYPLEYFSCEGTPGNVALATEGIISGVLKTIAGIVKALLELIVAVIAGVFKAFGVLFGIGSGDAASGGGGSGGTATNPVGNVLGEFKSKYDKLKSLDIDPTKELDADILKSINYSSRVFKNDQLKELFNFCKIVDTYLKAGNTGLLTAGQNLAALRVNGGEGLFKTVLGNYYRELVGVQVQASMLVATLYDIKGVGAKPKSLSAKSASYAESDSIGDIAEAIKVSGVSYGNAIKEDLSKLTPESDVVDKDTLKSVIDQCSNYADKVFDADKVKDLDKLSSAAKKIKSGFSAFEKDVAAMEKAGGTEDGSKVAIKVYRVMVTSFKEEISILGKVNMIFLKEVQSMQKLLGSLNSELDKLIKAKEAKK